MSRIRSAAARFFERAFPSRASTQTWMVLTFLFFVGIAVVAVWLYITFILRNEVQEAFHQTTEQEALRIAEIVESTPSSAQRI
ncbi:MAG: sensor histidine kinase, partial [Bacteroidetes bacterium]|nr:sensor histidine kinase [Bacteroidota bacterium]